MPAVELRRLRAQIHELSNWFGDPASYRKELKDILDRYANRAYRAGQAIKAQPLIPSYRVSPLILREFEVEFIRLGQELPEQALGVAEALWKDSYLEPRLLSTVLLGALPIHKSEAVLACITAWALPNENYQILDALFQNGTATLRRHAIELLLNLAEEWTGSSSEEVQALGIRLLIALIQDETFKNLPPVYRMLSPLVQKIPGNIQADLQAILTELIQRSPVETAYFLRQSLSIAQGPATARLVRRCMPLFAAEQQASLKAAIRAVNLS